MAFNIVLVNRNGKKEVKSSLSGTFNEPLKEPALVIHADIDGKQIFPLNLTPVENMLMRGVISIKDLKPDDYRRDGTSLVLQSSGQPTLFPEPSSEMAQYDDAYKWLLQYGSVAPIAVRTIYADGAIIPGSGMTYFIKFSTDVIIDTTRLVSAGVFSAVNAGSQINIDDARGGNVEAVGYLMA